ncbi:MAG TPA: hypothetical protein PK252_13545 [Bacteroidales bacterium]|nr:hypothetical protein [Bacteroidales bacterium]
MKWLKILAGSIIVVFLSLLLTTYVIWLGYPKKKINILILDKTVPDLTYKKHASLVWVLNNSRFVKNDGSNYSLSKDYYGFHPLKPISDYQYEIKRISLESVDSMANVYDAVYFADARGVYFNEWFRGFRQRTENSLIEGGFNQNDFLLLKAMHQKQKLVIAEFNILQKPTSDLISYKAQELFGVASTGWIGCYYASLDSSNIPVNILNLYYEQTGNSWSYSGEGVIFYNFNQVVVLSAKEHMNSAMPIISSKNNELMDKVPDVADFTSNFEVLTVADSMDVVAEFQLNVNSVGDSIISAMGIKSNFPAIIINKGKALNTVYFAGDFNDVDLPYYSSRLANSRQLLKYLSSDKKKIFFNEYYFPLIENIFKKYTENKK